MGTTEHNKPYQRQAQETCLLIFVAGERTWPACWECQPDCPARCSPHLTQRIYLLLPPPLPPPLLLPLSPTSIPSSIKGARRMLNLHAARNEDSTSFKCVCVLCWMLHPLGRVAAWDHILRTSAYGFLFFSYSPPRPPYCQQHCMHEQVSWRHARNSKTEV